MMNAKSTAGPGLQAESPNKQPLLELENLAVWFPITRGIFSRVVGQVKAVDDVSLAIYPGETLGLVGESGCGKTTLGRAILGLEKPQAGAVRFHGVDLTELNESHRRPYRKMIQMIFQDPFSSLNPRMTVLDIITEGLVQHKLLQNSTEEDAKFWLGEVGMAPDALYRYPHEFSGGQRQRICVARAISLQPEFIVCDEAVSALDVSVQAQVINLLKKLSQKYNLSYLFISHDLSVVRHISDRVAVMYLGKIVEFGNTDDLITNPLHPYTKALISAVPVPGVGKEARIVLEGDVPSPANPPPGCHFHTRCPNAMRVCQELVPRHVTIEGRLVTCHLYDDSVMKNGKHDLSPLTPTPSTA